MIRPILKYVAVIWSSLMKKDIHKLERIQRIVTKMFLELQELTYEERLKEMDLPSLKKRRERGDMITMYKLINGMETIDNDELLMMEPEDTRRTTGHSKKHRKGQCLKDKKRHSFPQRSIEAWNGLTEEIVAAKCVHNFKERLDKCRIGVGTTRD